MKDNKDEEKTLFQAIDAVDDKFLMETLKDMEKRKNKNHKQQLKFKQMTPMVKAATIAFSCLSLNSFSDFERSVLFPIPKTSLLNFFNFDPVSVKRNFPLPVYSIGISLIKESPFRSRILITL